MRILDTNILSHVFDGTPRVLERIDSLNDDIYTTIINQIEMLQARYAYVMKAADGQQLLRAQAWLNRTIALLEQFPAVQFGAAAANRFDALVASRKLRKIGRPDLLIASVALARGAVLVTRNVRDFEPIPGLVIENWMD
jgi:tRNA(fMet)-specific endonuclease VapC